MRACSLFNSQLLFTNIFSCSLTLRERIYSLWSTCISMKEKQIQEVFESQANTISGSRLGTLEGLLEPTRSEIWNLITRKKMPNYGNAKFNHLGVLNWWSTNSNHFLTETFLKKYLSTIFYEFHQINIFLSQKPNSTHPTIFYEFHKIVLFLSQN